jgi:hypothetical protein
VSAPRFLADEDFRNEIVRAVVRREPTIDFTTVQALGMSGTPDDQLLQFAWENNRVVVSHDANTMTAEAIRRINDGRQIAGLFIAPQDADLQAMLDCLLTIAGASEADEWHNLLTFLPW